MTNACVVVVKIKFIINLYIVGTHAVFKICAVPMKQESNIGLYQCVMSHLFLLLAMMLAGCTDLTSRVLANCLLTAC